MRLVQLPVELDAIGADNAPSVLDALDCLRLAVTVYDSAERLTYANAHYNYLFRALPPHDALIGRTYAELVALELACCEIADPGEPARYIAARRAQLHADDYAPFDIALFDGRVVEIKTRRTKDGGWIALWSDATQARSFVERAHLRLQQSEAEALRQATYLADLTRKMDAVSDEANTAKTTLLRTMSHELKTPLNAILGFADLMQCCSTRLTGEQIVEYSGLIHTAGTNLLRLINQILDLTRIAAGRFALNRVAQPLASVFADAIGAYASRAHAKNVSVVVEHCGEDAVAHADEAALATMVRNLVENAVNFTGDGGTVFLAAVREGALVRVRIRDNGPGVSAADLARITEPFEQAVRSIHGRPDGAGLGLPLVKALAELHGGGLVIESTPGEGFTATINVPASAFCYQGAGI